jgi:class 3 adenylate cyclase/tetratricopeptide (TPR) repeat protein
MSLGGDGTFRFEEFALDLRRGCLLDDGGEVELRPKSFEVLRYLVVNAGRLARKDEIISSVWSNLAVSDASLAQCMSEIRFALRDHDQHIIRTVARRGYLFAAPVTRSERVAPQRATPSRPVVAVSGRPETRPDIGTAQAGLAPPQPDGVAPRQLAERRQVTVMACEWVGLAGLAARLDPEDLRDIVAACRRHCAEFAARHQGRVALTLDDGALIYFGYPAASEHDAEHAIRAGLDLLAMPAPAASDGRPLGLRIGIASGVVVFDEQQLAVGATPHLARRLVAIASPGQLVIDQRTRRLVGEWFEYCEAGPVTLEDRTEAIAAFRVVAPSRLESRFEALRSGAISAVVGRDEEIDLVLRRWQRAIDGEGQLVLVSGEPGIGKSRLAAAVLDRIAGPHSLLRFYCSPHHADSPLYPIVRELERVAGLARNDAPKARLDRLDAWLSRAAMAADDRAILAALVSGAGDGRAAALDLSPQQRRRRTIDALTRLIEAEARRAPVVAVFEDVQWLDPSSLDVLGSLVDSIAGTRVLLVVTFRPDFAPPWIGAPHATLLTLNRLTRRHSSDLVGQIADTSQLSGEVRDAIVRRSDGVPLFLEELTRAVLEAGLSSAGLAAGASAPAQVPAALHAPLMARLDRLGPAKAVAQTAAAIGRDFSYELLAAVVECSEAELTDALDRLADAGLLMRQGRPPHATFLFKHALIQDVAYAALVREQRRALHRRIAAALEQDFPHVRANEPEILARHHCEAGSFEQAVAWWGEAGELALRRSAVEEAIAHLAKAIEVADLAARDGAPWASGGARVRLQIAYGQAHLWARSMQETLVVFTRARELATSLSDPSERFSTLYGLWAGSIMRPALQQAQEIAEAFQGDAQNLPGSTEAAVAQRILGTTLWHRGELTRARVSLEAAVAAPYPDSDRAFALAFGPDFGAAAGVLLAATLWPLGEVERSRRMLDQAVARAAGNANVLTQVYVHTYAFIIEMTRRDAARALPHLETLLALCREHSLTHLNYVEICQVATQWRLGERQHGLTEMRHAVERLRNRGVSLGAPWCMTLLAEVEMTAGDAGASLATIDTAIAEAKRTGEHWYMAESERLRGDILLAQHRADKAAAEQAYRTALATAQQQKARSHALRAALSLARLQVATGRSSELQTVLAPALAGFAPTVEVPDVAEAQALLAKLAAGRTGALRTR